MYRSKLNYLPLLVGFSSTCFMIGGYAEYCHQDPHTQRWYWKVADNCSAQLIYLLKGEYPWLPNQACTKTITDPIDSIINLCSIYRRSRECIHERLGDINDMCLVYGFSGNYLDVQWTLGLLCEHTRNETLLQSLQCLHDTRILNTLQFRAWSKCGRGMFSQQSDALKNADFVLFDMQLNVPSEILQEVQKSLFCVPEHSIPCYLSSVVKLCGRNAMTLVEMYFTKLHNDLENILKSAKSCICCSDNYVKTGEAGQMKKDIVRYGRALDVGTNNDTLLETGHGKGIWGIF